MKHFLTFLLFLKFLYCSLVFANIDDAIVVLPGRSQIGSGVHIGNGLVLTARHVLQGMTASLEGAFEGRKKVSERFPDTYQIYTPALSKEDRDSFYHQNRIFFDKIDRYNDWAILYNRYFEKTLAITKRKSPTRLRQGDQLKILGKPNLYNLEIVYGTFLRMEGNNFLMKASGLRPGFSGGAVLDQEGFLVGIIFAWDQLDLGAASSIDQFPR